MAEEGSVSLRPQGFTPYHSFIINLHHLGLGELESRSRQEPLCSHCVAACRICEVLLTTAIKDGEEKREKR